ncbi:elongation factor P hydroxylase [Halioxenophilus aromaticivorans]
MPGPSILDTQSEHLACDIERLFNRCFAASQLTQLVGGCIEPLYRPAADGGLHTIFYSHDYFASALHEIAHWCVAGRLRRQQEDYGYWYAPDGRSQSQQDEFERVEVKPQALEWLFSAACGFRFRVSADNLALCCGPSEAFKANIVGQVHQYLAQEIPPRARQFCDSLADYYGGDYRRRHQYHLEALR